MEDTLFALETSLINIFSDFSSTKVNTLHLDWNYLYEFELKHEFSFCLETTLCSEMDIDVAVISVGGFCSIKRGNYIYTFIFNYIYKITFSLYLYIFLLTRLKNASN